MILGLPALVIISLSGLLALALMYLSHPLLGNPDSWLYLELSKTVFGDFYRSSTTRYYMAPDGYSQAFPPLWPVLIALFNSVADWGIYATYVLAVAAAGLALIPMVMLGRELFGDSRLGAVLFIGTLIFGDYRIEAFGGRSMPLSILLFCILLYLFISRNQKPFLIGAIAGLMFMNRFDCLPAGLILGIMLLLTTRRAAAAALYYAAFLIFISPWVYYSMTHFGTPFASDGRMMALAADSIYVTDFFLTPPPTLFDEPARWALKAASNSVLFSIDFIWGAKKHFVLVMLAVAAVVLLAEKKGAGALMEDWRFRRLLLFGLVPLAGLPLLATAGLNEPRFFTSAYLYLSIVLIAVVVRLSGDAQWRLRQGMIAVSVALLVLGTVARFIIHSPRMAVSEDALYSPRLHAIARALRESDVPEPRLWVHDRTLVDPFMLGSQTGVRTFVTPHNLTSRTLVPFLKANRITHVIILDARIMEMLGLSSARALRIAGAPLIYAIEPGSLERAALPEAELKLFWHASAACNKCDFEGHFMDRVFAGPCLNP